MKLGEENTKFFHSNATIKYRHNHISIVQDRQGEEHNEHEAKGDIFWRAFKHRLGSQIHTSIPFDLIHVTSARYLIELDASFISEEIEQVIKENPPNKPPSPDGFNDAFMKAF